MKTKAAILWGLNQPWEIEEVELDGPKRDEVTVKLVASGLCHSDHHLVTGDIPRPFPVVGGHEGAGIVVDVGPGSHSVEVGDHVVMSFLPACGRCRPCARGISNLCELGALLMVGPQLDGTYRFHSRGQGVGQNCVLGTFAEYTTVPVASVIKIDPSIDLAKAAASRHGRSGQPGVGPRRRAGGHCRADCESCTRLDDQSALVYATRDQKGIA